MVCGQGLHDHYGHATSHSLRPGLTPRRYRSKVRWSNLTCLSRRADLAIKVNMCLDVICDEYSDLITHFCLQVAVLSPASGGRCGWSSSREEAG